MKTMLTLLVKCVVSCWTPLWPSCCLLLCLFLFLGTGRAVAGYGSAKWEGEDRLISQAAELDSQECTSSIPAIFSTLHRPRKAAAIDSSAASKTSWLFSWHTGC
ncbi:hypothetical protein LIA77_05616 [Sarocladium implicatum]|nr:hypothetical protein LIA77_05616 [Sarocladium implicatum]